MKNNEVIVVVTGASRGIGFAMVEELLKFDYVKTIAVTRNKSKLDNLVKRFPERIDLSTLDYLRMSDDDIKKAFDSYEKVDVLINNAAILEKKDFEGFSNEDIQELFQVNVFGTMQIIRCLLPLLQKASGAHVVNVSSMAGVMGAKKFKGLSVYSATKAAICSLTESLAEEYKNTSVRFNCVAPGAVDTEMFVKAFPGSKTKTSAKKMASFIADFALNNYDLFNGKIIQVNETTP